jgi:hypothetical protein
MGTLKEFNAGPGLFKYIDLKDERMVSGLEFYEWIGGKDYIKYKALDGVKNNSGVYSIRVKILEVQCSTDAYLSEQVGDEIELATSNQFSLNLSLRKP